ncbi:putative oligopeptide transporter, OPT family [Desulforamulus putei DSM 12395]|uniref:Putative oligopeptide transporter, OPT family n=1 Tax=Desulforamulus putei DSM 12395 TaxID=1121429 RepID=A0A1M4U2H7_9FIRM|nr:oligopeptide transporter, OPT family [Desulforamulus putei]SHE50903.1 putative oligopeptide transporter, OPT family [Desulforamulus putei DSM 12395]
MADATKAKQDVVEESGMLEGAYGGIPGDRYVPFVSPERSVVEFTVRALVIGAVLSVLFGVANTYLGLKVGLTVSASIPAAVLATGLYKLFFRSGNILERNIVQTVASSGESIAGGIIFTIPALLLWGMDISVLTVVIVSALGGLIGILFFVPLRRYLTVEEHGNLIYPEGMACAEVLVSGEKGGAGAGLVFTGIAVGGLYKLFSGGLLAWNETPEWKLPFLSNGLIGVNALPSLLGVGFIVGYDVGKFMLAGGLVAWMLVIPLISYFGHAVPNPIFPSTVPIAEMDAWGIWSKYVRYIGAGAVAAGGFISLARSAPTIIRSFRAAMTGLAQTRGGDTERRTEKDLSLAVVIGGTLLVALLIIFLPQVPGGIVGALLVLIFGFFFAAVSSRITGIVGVSNNPVSGMTIATLLVVSAIVKGLGWSPETGMVVAITLGSIVCVAIAVAGATAQNGKTTFILGGTPKYVQIGQYVGVLACAYFVGAIIVMLHGAYTMGSADLPAPQATLMSMVTKGVITGTLPWEFVIMGLIVGVAIFAMGLPVLPFALGFYLPLHLSMGILVGGIVRILIERGVGANELKDKVERGVLISSGLIAGDALVGIVIAFFAYIEYNIAFLKGTALAASNWFALVMFLLVAWFTYWYTNRQDVRKNLKV